MNKLILSMACIVPLTLTHGAILSTPPYNFSNENQRVLIKREAKSFVNDLTRGTPCLVSFDYLNEGDVLQFDRNVEIRINIIKNNKQVYSNYYDLNRENFVNQMIQFKQVVDYSCLNNKK